MKSTMNLYYGERERRRTVLHRMDAVAGRDERSHCRHPQHGAKNVLIADGLEHGEELTNAPALTDMVSPVIYASHPYAHNYQDQNATGTEANGTIDPNAGWNLKFGTFAASNPVMVTEWGNGYYCDNITGTQDVVFLQYLQGLGVGLVATTWDWAGPNFGSVRVNFPTNTTITSFPVAGTPICHVPAATATDPTPAPVIDDGVGPGQLVQTWFTTGTPSQCSNSGCVNGVRRENAIPVSAEIAVLVQQQQAEVRASRVVSEFLFPNSKGGVLKQASFAHRINRLAYDHDVRGADGKLFRFQAHQFRHTVGTRMVNLGVPHHIIQRYLGHKGPEMTSRYAHIHDTTMRDKLSEYLKSSLVDVTGPDGDTGWSE